MNNKYLVSNQVDKENKLFEIPGILEVYKNFSLGVNLLGA
jgi:hypothetical protein